MEGLKRKHVVFEGQVDGPPYDEQPAAEQAATAIPGLHPSRAQVVDWVQPAKKPKQANKTKSDKKKKYLAKKQRNQRAKKVAAKASKPKNSTWDGDEDGESDSDDSDDDEEEGAKAGPSTTTEVATVKKTAEEEERELRQAEKAAIRDARREERKAKRKAERLARAAKEAAQAEKAAKAAAREAREEARAAGMDVEDEGEVEEAEEQAEDAEMDESADENEADADEVDAEAVPDLPTRLSPSPPPLEPFPLPRMAPAPSDAVLSRQGMPSGLADAEFIEQDTRLSVAALASSLGAGSAGLSERTQKRLTDLGVEEFFAVQAAMLPHLLSLPLVPLPHAPLSDYLVSAPTGSGKTLAYAIPVVEVLAKRVVPRLRALIVLPTRDLVVQVRETLEALAKGTGLMIGSVTGQHSFAQEQTMLVGDSDPLVGGVSKLDILIATPGRLMDHLASTPNFTLQHLRFLVIDEADRLLTQSFQNWLTQVLSHAAPPARKEAAPKGVQPYDAVAPAWTEPLGLASGEFEGSEGVSSTCQKLLFSATLTRDPAKVAALDLSSPRYYIVQSSANPLTAAAVGSSFALPAELGEKMLILPPALKPLNLIHLIHSPQFSATPALVFAKSVEAATRLVKLLEFFEDAYVGAKKVVVRGYTRDMPPAERKRLLTDFAAGKVDVVVASDLVARGIDLPAVAHVISYDVPLDMTKYVHRAGRTARAGREGTAWTLVEKQEAIHFKAMLKGAGHEQAVKKVKVKEDELAGYRESYDISMRRLRDAYSRD